MAAIPNKLTIIAAVIHGLRKKEKTKFPLWDLAPVPVKQESEKAAEFLLQYTTGQDFGSLDAAKLAAVLEKNFPSLAFDGVNTNDVVRVFLNLQALL